jgi:uncharacterized protein (TIGR02145 family)
MMKPAWSRFLFFVGLMILVEGCSSESAQPAVKVITAPATNITPTGATSGGTILSDGGSAITIRGVCWSKSPNPTTLLPTVTNDGSGIGTFTSTLTGLTAGTYYLRAFAINSTGKFYGDEITFEVVLPGPQATISTLEASSIGATSVQSGGMISSDGGTPVTERGVCWSTSHLPTIALPTRTSDGSGIGTFTSAITGLTTWTTYYARAFATNGTGTYYGSEVVIVPIPPVTFGTVADADGNNYKTVVIGNQTWMAENLRVSKYQDGSALVSGLAAPSFGSTNSGAFIDFDNSPSSAGTYGHLYNSYAVDDVRNICPAGWHVPSSAEWNELALLLGGSNVAGTRMKEVGVTHWASPNVGANNSSGFTGLGGGSIHLGNFVDFGTDGYWWSSNTPSFYYLTNDLFSLRNKSSAVQGEGLSIRCVKN